MMEKYRYTTFNLYPAEIIVHGVLLCTNAFFVFMLSQGLGGPNWGVFLGIVIVAGALELYVAVLFYHRLRTRFELALGQRQLEWGLYRGSKSHASLSLAVESVAQLVLSGAAGSKLPRDNAHAMIRSWSNFYPMFYSVSLIERDGTRHLLLETSKRKVASELLDTLARHYPSLPLVHELDNEQEILQRWQRPSLEKKCATNMMLACFFGFSALVLGLGAYSVALDYEQNPPHVWHEREALLLKMRQEEPSDSDDMPTSYFTVQYDWKDVAQVGEVDTRSDPSSVLARNHEGKQCLTIYVNERKLEDIRLKTPSRGFSIMMGFASFACGCFSVWLLVLRARYKRMLKTSE